MQRDRAFRGNRRTVREQPRVKPLDAALMECDEPRNQVQHLHNLLHRERQEKKQLSQELEETKQQLAKQKSLKEMYINREKESRRESERVKKFADPETLSTCNLAVQVNDIVRQKKKKDLHKDYEQLRVAYIISQEKFTAELDMEKQRNKLLQEEVERTRVSYHDMTVRYETQILTLQQQAELNQREHDIQIQAHADRLASDQQMMQNLKSAQDALVDKMAEEMRILQKNALADQTSFRTQTEELMSQLNSQISLNHELSMGLEAERKLTEDLMTQLNSQISLNHELSMGLKAEREDDCRPPVSRREEEPRDEQRQQEPRPHGVTVKDLDQAEVCDDTVPPEASKQEPIPHGVEVKDLDQAEVCDDTVPPEASKQEPCPHGVTVKDLDQAEVCDDTVPPEANKQEPLPHGDTLKDLDQAEVSDDTVLPEANKQEPIPDRSTTPVETDEVSQIDVPETTKGQPSLWKRIRHFLGLKKPKKWKKTTRPQN
ncbi:hypothetical protein ABVT39_003463 [Epinephelus coioides]